MTQQPEIGPYMEAMTEEQRLRFLLDLANDQLTGQADFLFLLERFLIGLEHHIADDSKELDRMELLLDAAAAKDMARQLRTRIDAARRGMLLQAGDLGRFFLH